MVAKIDGSDLVVRVPINAELLPSSTGATLLYATAQGQSGLTVEGQPLRIGLNAYVRNPNYVAPPRKR